MLDSTPREREWVSWSFVALWSVVIFLTIPFARHIQWFVSDHWGRQTFSYLVIGVVVITAVAAAAHLLRRRAARVGNYVWLLLVAAIFIRYTIQLRAAPEEAFHFVQYGVLGLFTYRALSHRIHDAGIYIAAAVVAAIVGIIDEVIQWLTPERFWGLKDIWLNFFAGALTQLAIAKGLRPSLITGPPSPYSIQYICRVCAIALVLLGASLFNTPSRIAWYAERIQPLAFLMTNESMMIEYGYLYIDPEIGRFRSRLSPFALTKNDVERARDAARILDRYRERSEYREEFLRIYNPMTDPFVHEARVHLFRRNRFLRKAEEVKNSDENEYRDRLTVAFRENRIMEKYFPHTLAQSSYVLPREQIAFLAQNQLATEVFDSRVSQGLITQISERELAFIFALGLCALFLVHRHYKKKSTSTH